MTKILFVCHGNICRSPMAEYVMKDLVKKENTHLPTYAYFDGVYFWTDEDTYHFEKYDMRLNDEFVNHVLEALDSGKKED